MNCSIHRQNSTKNYLSQNCCCIGGNEANIFRPQYYLINSGISCDCDCNKPPIDEDDIYIYDGGPVGGWK